MTPRTRVIPDSVVIQAATRVLKRTGIEQFRLADVAVESGLAAPTLVQRFGSREGLLEAIGRGFVADVTDVFRLEAPTHLARLAKAFASIDAHQHMLFLVARTAHGPAYSLALRKHIAFALGAAVEQGELPPCGVAELARHIQAAFYGLVYTSVLEKSPLTPDDIGALLAQALADV